ncbi:FAD-dependent oxidoreductase [Leptospira ilyithenensis]|uniref:FAD-dependent oxidoreductase n=1 Tax=Leptospira ilyithenensis TaxID=2484901 RepID=A0A4R9LLQ8_9LEPT|nr:FAD-dependent oxidoreductase [Leptospira ilyithenensis]TGN07094.1 FAD-dependent oxidoreductase [Leptospira ilyithenensis]
MTIWSILGSGVTGLCVATTLYEQGELIEVIESPHAQGASHLAGGMLSPFCEGENAPQIVVEQGQFAANWWKRHVSCVIQNGSLVLAPARDSAELLRFARMTQCYEWVSPGMLEPDLGDRFAKGLFYPSEAHLDPRQALGELKQKLINAGVDFHTNRPNGRIIDCRGIQASAELSDLRSIRGEMIILQSEEISLSRSIRLLHPRFPCYIVPRDNNRFMVGATMVESSKADPICARAIMELLSSAYSVHPSFAEASVVEVGAGLRPAFFDNVPAIHFKDGKFFVNGMYRHGFLLAPILAEKLLGQLTQTQESGK